MGSSQENYQAEWVNDYRRSRRWMDARTVLARLDGEETLGKTLDVSVGGMKVDLQGIAPLVGRRLEMAVVFGDRIVDLGGTVLHRTRSDSGSIVGMEFDQPLEQHAAAFLSVQYPPTMEGFSVDRSGNA
ncbi:MAG TPA: PilZ domain-containing protein [Deferrisomatales bacterium]|nr:PilZ domain-containing protein [Deferrisomatales bacterium]